MKKIFLLVLVTVGITLVYQLPYKKYLTEQKLYELLRKENIDEKDIHIENILKDIKSSRGGYVVFFSVSESSLSYQYDYSFKGNNWIKTYEKNGLLIQNEYIILDLKK